MVFVRLSAIILITAGFFFAAVADADAQRRVSYQQLKAQNQAPGLYVDHNILPAEADADNVWINFRFGHDVLNFRQRSGSTERFEASAEMTIRIFEAGSETDLDEIRNETPLHTLSWSGRARTETFESTRSATEFLNGNLSLNLPPGRYAYSPTITIDGRSVPLRRNIRTFTVPDFNSNKNLPIYFTEHNDDESTYDFSLVNYGRSVLYAEDFSALFFIPDESRDYTVVVQQLNISGNDTTITDTVFEESISSNSFRQVSRISMRTQSDNSPYLRLHRDGDNNHTLAQLAIPNRRFQNASFRIRLMEGDEIISSRNFRSLWIDIPTSLLNVDVAISMMQIIMESEDFRQLRRGNEQERIRKFREFWSERDPEPETDYNPLMVEFFRRVDIAFDRFSSPNAPGYETDQGRIFIRHGEPDNITRRLPSGSPAIEVWSYSNREFTFEATSGFGEYRLLNRSSR
ncbi:MAG: GWxTD domain-containing protein [Balneolia bacterium]|nr:GWxTD domain-containing protein [Balneolia bacterium]